MMKKKIKFFAILFLLGMFQVSQALEVRSDDLIKRDIVEQITKNEVLKNSTINVQVKDRLVVLMGDVRLYEEKLVASRIAWSTSGVFEIDNEIRVIPRLPLADKVIEREVRKIIKKYPVLNGLNAVVKVKKGVVSISGSFTQINGPTFLRHKVAVIEGVISIDIQANLFSIKQQPEDNNLALISFDSGR